MLAAFGLLAIVKLQIASASFPLDEFSLRRIYKGCSAHGKTLLFGLEHGFQVGSTPKLYLFDFATEQVREFADPRVPVRFTSGLLPTEGGFAVATEIAGHITFAFLGRDGSFAETKRYGKLESGKVVAVTISAIDSETALISYRETSQETPVFGPLLRLVTLSYASMEIRPLAEIPVDPDLGRTVAFADGTNFWLVEGERGEIFPLSPKFEKGQSLLPHRALIPANSYGALQLYGYMDYFPVIFANGRGLTLNFIDRATGSKDRYGLTVTSSHPIPEKSQTFLVGAAGEKGLYFNIATSEFLVR